MAIEKPIEVRELGATANYHRIAGFDVIHAPEADVAGCKGSVYVRIASYASKETTSTQPLRLTTLRLRFGADVASETSKGAPAAVIRSDEPTRAEIYGALSQVPMFADAA